MNRIEKIRAETGNLLVSFALLVAIVIMSPSVNAEEESTEQGTESDLMLEEITVTATRRAENLQNIGIAISAFRGEFLETRGIVDTADLGIVTTSLIVAKASGSGFTGLVSIRGVSQNDFTAHLESPNAFYIDGIYQPFASTGVQQFYDVERIEVLKGPQGTLFGRNATGGLLNVFTRDPSNEFGGYLIAGIASYDQIDIKGGISIPLSETLKARVAFLRTRHDGYYKNLNPDGVDLNSDNTEAIRVKLFYTPNERLTVRLNLDYYHVDYIGAGGNWTVPAGQDPVTGLGFNLPIDTPFALGGGTALQPFQTSANFAGGYFRETWGASAIIRYDFDEISFSSITSYADAESLYEEDNDQTFADVATFHQESSNTSFSQEFRLHKDNGQFRWNAGVYFLDVNGEYFNRLNFAVADADLNVNYDIDAKSYSAFAQGSWDFAEKFTLTVGGRVVREEKTYFQVFECISATAASFCPAFGGPGTIGGASPLSNKHNETDWVGRLQLDYQANANLLLYASVNRGYKGFNYNANMIGNVPLDQLIPEGEHLLALETGIKHGFWGGRARLNAAVFYYDYTNYHAFDLSNLSPTLFNADAEIYGAEADLTFNLGSGWLTSLGMTLLHARVFDVPISGLGKVTRDVAQSPDFSILASVEKSAETKIGLVTAIVNAVYYADQFAQISNAPNTLIETYNTVNARVIIEPYDYDISVTFYVRNALDNTKSNYAYDLSGAGYTQLSIVTPRIWGVEFRYDF